MNTKAWKTSFLRCSIKGENMKMGSSSLEKYDCLERRQVTLFLNFADEFKFHDTHTSKIRVSKNQMPEMPSYLHQEILLKLMLL